MAHGASRIALACLVLLALVVGWANLTRTLANPDEGRYSEISREMVASGDWVTPRLDGLKYFEKPPLQYWATAVAFEAFGESDVSARLYVAFCGLGALLLTVYTASRLGIAGLGLGTALALMASPYFMTMGGVVTLDTGLTLWTTLTLCAYLLAERPGLDPAMRRRWMLVAWAGMAFAVLSKGLVGIVFPAAAMGLHCLVHRDFRPLARLEWLRGVALMLAIAAPWFVLVSRANPEFAHFFFIHEHVERFLTTQHRRTEPWWFFVPILFVGFLPWMFALPSAARHAWKGAPARGHVAPLRFALLWAAFIVVFFSASGSKLPAYILPAFPAVALALGAYVAQAPERKLAWQIAPVVLVGVALVVAAWQFPAGAKDEWTRDLYVAARPWVVAAALDVLVVAGLAAWLLRARKRWPALLLVAGGMVVVIGCVVGTYNHISPRQSGAEVAATMKPLATPAARLYSVGTYEQTVPFYIGRTLTLVNYVDEFELGLKAEPGRGIPTLEAFAPDWLRPGEALAIMHPDTFKKLRERGLPMQVVHEDPRRVLVRKP